jgi:glutathione reductase (NADPH)
VGDRVISAERILLATGGYPHIPESDYADLLTTSDQIFDLPQFPDRILVVGGGYIAVEFASIFNGLGSKVQLVYRGDALLRGFDDDIQIFLGKEMQRKGVNIHFNRNLACVTRLEQGGLLVRLDDHSEYEVDVVLSATGRRPRIAGLDLEQVGVAVDQKGSVCINEHFQTSVPNIYALGDVVGRMELTPVALEEAIVLLDYLYGNGEKCMDYNLIPTAVFSQPSVATLGLTEQQAQDKYTRVNVFQSDFKALKHTVSGNDERTLMKLVVDEDSDRVVGIHMVGEHAGEILQGFAVALKAGARKADFDRTLGIHPTSAEEFVTMRTPVYGS